MAREPVGGIVASACSSCAGVWLDPADLRALRRRRSRTRREQARNRATFVPHDSGAVASCPSCPSGLLRAGSAGGHRVLACTSCHGVFFPAEEPRTPREPSRPESGETSAGAAELLTSLAEIASALL